MANPPSPHVDLSNGASTGPVADVRDDVSSVATRTNLHKRRRPAPEAEPQVSVVHTPHVRHDLTWGEPVSTPEPPLVRTNRLFKRPFDLLVGLTIALFALPVIAIVALAVRLGSPGPVFYSAERIGRNGVPFRCYKFRSMRVGADAYLEQVLAEDPELRKEFAETAKLKDDPRITPIGRFLRKTSLDELPQLLNVLRGDMSLVGPRPVPGDEALRYGFWLPQVQTVRPGLTGLWQVSGRNDISYKERAELDYVYSASHTLHGDLLILLKTVLVVLKPLDSGAY